jgi:hypothetical protein
MRGLAPKPTAYRVLGRRAVTALATVSAITEGGELRRAVLSEPRDSAIASASLAYAVSPEVLRRLSAAMPPHSRL